MVVALVLAASVAVAAVAVYVMTAEPSTALAGETTVVGLSDAASETLVGGRTTPPARTDWQLTAVTDLTDAEDLLDCLEAQGIAERELVVLGNSCFAVRWR